MGRGREQWRGSVRLVSCKLGAGEAAQCRAPADNVQQGLPSRQVEGGLALGRANHYYIARDFVLLCNRLRTAAHPRTRLHCCRASPWPCPCAGNFKTLAQAIAEYSADAMRIALADAGARPARALGGVGRRGGGCPRPPTLWPAGPFLLGSSSLFCQDLAGLWLGCSQSLQRMRSKHAERAVGAAPRACRRCHG